MVVTTPSNFVGGKVIGKTITLSPDFSDDAWVTYQDAMFAGESPLNKWKDKKIKRCKPTKRGDMSFMCKNSWENPPTLVHANEHHILVLTSDGKETLLGPDFVNPNDWTLAE